MGPLQYRKVRVSVNDTQEIASLCLGEENLFTFYAYPHFALARFAVLPLPIHHFTWLIFYFTLSPNSRFI